MEKLPPALEGLGRYRQFVVYMLVPSLTYPGATDKIPVHPTQMWSINPHDPDNWLSADEALRASAALPIDSGIGFVFTQNDPYWFLDIDKCLQADNQWSPLSRQLMEYFKGAAVEVSQSGRGLHIIGSGVSPEHRCKNKTHGLEFYTESRFVALTGRHTTGSVDCAMTHKLGWLVDTYFPANTPGVGDTMDWTYAPTSEWNGPLDDDVLLNKAMSTMSAMAGFGHKAPFAALFNADEDVLSRCYPDSSGKPRAYDASSADMALAAHLAFWTGKDCNRIERLMLRSKLVRDKWDREDYRQRTILNACKMTTSVYSVDYRAGGTVPPPVQAVQQGTVADAVPPALKEVAEKTGSQFMPASLQPEFFRGCVYVRNIHRVLVPNGDLLKPEQFKATYSGFVFALDTQGSKTTKNAWEAFIDSQAFKFPKVHRHVFRPELPPLKIFQEDGDTVVNSYVPLETRQVAGDPAPFLDLLQRMIPREKDRKILLSYMAAIVQYPGVKFRWCPVIQGAEGNGKTTLLDCVRYAVGARYSHFPNATDLTNKFNSWLAEKLFIGINEIYVGDHKDMRDTLYPLISDEGVEIQRKGADKEWCDNRVNFMMTTNFREAVRVTKDTRRWWLVFTAQQCKEDILRHGMGGSYFPHLHRWLRKDGFAIVNHYLHNYKIDDEYNPAGLCTVAPGSSEAEQAEIVATGQIEQEVLESIELGLPGFRGGWVSSVRLDTLLKDRRFDRLMPRNKRREMMRSLGYDWHPALLETNGRINQPIMAENNSKPVLFAKVDNPPFAQTPDAARERYMIDQGYSPQ